MPEEKWIERRVTDGFSAAQTFSCGQCFRWNRTPGTEDANDYTGIAFGVPARVVTGPGFVRIRTAPGAFQDVWSDYFDLDLDYARIRSLVSVDGPMRRAAAFGLGIRILRQEPWETLCSFILSQCNNIPRIRGIVETLCARFGRPVEFEGRRMHAFPDAGTIAALDGEALSPLRAGYRAPYLLAAARRVAEGALDFAALSQMPTAEAKLALTSLPGVGEKVAACVLLFGLHRLDAFPVDVWVRRSIGALYGEGFDPAAAFGRYAGVAQQYIFYYAREHGGAGA